MDGKRAAPRKGRRVVFVGGVCTCRAGPMCPAEKCVPGGGAHGPRPTGRYVEPRVGDGVSTSRQRGGAALLGPLWEGAVDAADWGREKRGASLPPSALRADTSLSEGGEGRRIPTPVFALARNDRERADRVVRPYKGLSKIPARDVVPQGHLFRCAPLQDAVPYNSCAGRRGRRPLRAGRCPLRAGRRPLRAFIL